MTRRSLLWALVAAILAALLAFALLPVTATGTPLTGAGDQPSFRFVPLRGVDARGRPSPPAALSEPALPAPPTPLSASPSLRPRLAAVRRPNTSATAEAASVSANPPAVAPTAARVGLRESVTGLASWFRSPAGVSAAGPRLRSALGPGWRGTRVRVCTATACATTKLGDWMRADRLIDLDSPVFARLAPLSVGLLPVTVTPILTPPETSVAAVQ